jgi:lysophospholipase
MLPGPVPSLVPLPVHTEEVVYRVAGHDPALGPCAGLLRVEGGRARFEQHGRPTREGLTVRAGPAGEVEASHGAGLELRGRRLELSREADLRPGDPAGTAARYLASVAAARGGTIAGRGGVPLRWVAFEAHPERAALVVLPGRTEPAERYGELAADLVPLGYTVFVLDVRGQGRSGRLLGRDQPPGSPEFQKGHVERFEDYVDDLGTFLRAVVRGKSAHAASGDRAGRRVFGLGHSMGAAILTRRAQLHPRDLDALALSSPMFRIPVPPLGPTYIRLQLLLGRGEEYARGVGPLDPTRQDFETNNTTHSQARFRWKFGHIPGPELWLGGPTYRWVHEALRMTAAVRADAARLRTPTLALQASEDEVVVNSGQDEVAAAAPAVVTKVVIQGALHELLMEADVHRRAALLAIIAFLDRCSQDGRGS